LPLLELDERCFFFAIGLVERSDVWRRDHKRAHSFVTSGPALRQKHMRGPQSDVKSASREPEMLVPIPQKV
jgi:hypothetical protein